MFGEWYDVPTWMERKITRRNLIASDLLILPSAKGVRRADLYSITAYVFFIVLALDY